MNHTLPLLAASLLFTTTACNTHPCYDAPGSTSHLCWAEDLVEHVSPEYNSYSAEPSVIRWEGVNGSFRYQNWSRVSRFVTTMLIQSDQMTPELQKTLGTGTSPFAADYFFAIERNDVFTEVYNALDIKAGDIVAIRFPTPEDSYEECGDSKINSGHVAIARGPARLITQGAPCDPKGDTMDGKYQYALDIVNSSRCAHGPSDSRYPIRNGAGFVTMRLFTDHQGSIVGFSWSPDETQCHASSVQPLVVGRLP